MSELKAISGHEIREDIDYNTRGIDPEDKEWCKYGKELCETLYCEDKLGTVVKPGWWDKWRKRWLELAEKFKEAK